MSVSAGPCYAVVGLGLSGRAVIRYLHRTGAAVRVYDRQGPEQLGAALADLPPGSVARCGPDYLDQLEADLPGLGGIVVTPGMPKDLPVLRKAEAAGIPLLGEAALVLRLAPLPVIGITGSAGKTTTTTLVGEVAVRSCPGSVVGGNIGLPLIDRLDDLPVGSGAWLVLELSSFQIDMATTSPRIAALLNLRPNHLDVHGSFAAYREAKSRIYRFQGPTETAVFSADDPAASALAYEAPGVRLLFSRRGPVPAGAGVRDGQAIFFPPSGGDPIPVLGLEEIPLPGQHNVDNVLAAIAICGAAGMPMPVVADVVRGFRGVRHRLELVRMVRGQKWINDSIATAPDRTMAALETFRGTPIVLLAGGYDKHLPLEALAVEIVAGVQRLIVYGAMAEQIADAVRAAAAGGPGPTIERAADLEEAVHAAAADPRPGRVVLLSPACASYDQFRNFEERGQRFKDLVAALPD